MAKNNNKARLQAGCIGLWGHADELKTQKAQTASPEFWGIRPRGSDVKGCISDALRRHT